jgi:hypothetical protein
LSCLLAGPTLAQTPALFSPVITYSVGVGSEPNALAVADVNGDGKLDLLTANYRSNTAGVLLGAGTGTFGPVITYPTGTGSTPAGIAAADVNADGKPDLLTANQGSSTVGVLLGTSTGTFGLVTTYSTLSISSGSGYGPRGIAVADVNGDGRPDLLTANYLGNSVGVLLNAGSGTFGPATLYSAGYGSTPTGIVVADVNGDGKLDLLTANLSSDTAGVLLGTGTGTFSPVTTYPTGNNSGPRSLAVADVNADGKLDLLLSNNTSGAAAVLLGTGTGSFGAATTYSTGYSSYPRGIAVADVNGDGKLDLLTANSNTIVAGVLLGTGTGTFGPMTTYYTGFGSTPFDLVVADVNGDGKPDLVTANNSSDTAGVLLNATTFLASRAALPGTNATLAPNPARTSALLGATGLPAATRTLEATLLNSVGQLVRRFNVPAVLGTAQGHVPLVGLTPGLYVLHLSALDAQGTPLGDLPTQRLSVE